MNYVAKGLELCAEERLRGEGERGDEEGRKRGRRSKRLRERVFCPKIP